MELFDGITVAMDQGFRPYQEDAHAVKEINNEGNSGFLMAVADGHGGDYTSLYVRDRLYSGLFEFLLSKEKGDKLKTLERLYESLIEETWNSNFHRMSGTTLSTVYAPKDEKKVYVGVIGDSPVILASKDPSRFHLSPEHNVRSNEKEKEDAIKRGGIVDGGYLCAEKNGPGLQMSRDIGYYDLGNILLRYPDVYSLDLREGESIIVGSDGLLDPGHSSTEDQAKRLAKLVIDGADAEDLVKDAKERHTGDNVTAIVYKTGF